MSSGNKYPGQVSYYEYKPLLTAAGEDEGLGGVGCEGPHVVRVGVKRVLSLQCVVVEHSDLSTVTSHYNFAGLKALKLLLVLVITPLPAYRLSQSPPSSSLEQI